MGRPMSENGTHTTVPGGDWGGRLRELETRIVTLDARDTEQHAAVVQRLDALTRSVEAVGEQLVGRLEALADEHRRTVTLRLIDIVGDALRRLITPASAPIYAVCLLATLIAFGAAPVAWQEIRIGQQTNANQQADTESPPTPLTPIPGPEPTPSPGSTGGSG